MLPAPLLRSRVSSGRVTPLLVTLSSDNLSLASRMIDAFNESVGLKKRVLDDKVQRFEEESVDYKLVRGLAALLERRCVFQSDAPIDPVEARRMVFTEASLRRVSTREERSRVIQTTAEKIGLTSDTLEWTLWSDLDSNLILKRFEFDDDAALLRWYNLSLMQTLLFKSLSMSFTASGNWKNIFREVKWLGLMYSVEKDGDMVKVGVDGPLSIFKMVDRYGTSLAKLIPQIVRSEEWSISADILSRGERKRIYRFELRSSEVKNLLPTTPVYSEQQYDSSVEQKFAASFNSLETGWLLKREPEPLITGNRVLIPDFSFEKEGAKVYLEIAGFWTQDYLEKKIQKLKALVGVDMVVAVDERLACSKVKDIRGDVIFFQGTLPAKDIYRVLKRREERLLAAQVEKMKNIKVELTGDYVKINDLAERIGVSAEAVKQAIRQTDIGGGYVRVSDSFISVEMMTRLRERLEALSEPSLTKVQSIFSEEGVDEPYGVIEALGYEVVWIGLDAAASRVMKKSGEAGEPEGTFSKNSH